MDFILSPNDYSWCSDINIIIGDYILSRQILVSGDIKTPADKRDLTTTCNKLTNTHLKSVKNHNSKPFKDGSFMRDA